MIIFIIAAAVSIASVTTDKPQTKTSKEIYEQRLKERR